MDQGFPSTPDSEDLYVVVADLRNCYDRILHPPLLERIDHLPLQKSYKILPMSLQRGTGRWGTVEMNVISSLDLETLGLAMASIPNIIQIGGKNHPQMGVGLRQPAIWM